MVIYRASTADAYHLRSRAVNVYISIVLVNVHDIQGKSSCIIYVFVYPPSITNSDPVT